MATDHKRGLIHWPITFLLFMSGVSPAEAYESGEQRRYASIGALMSLMFIWYGLAMGHALTSTTGNGKSQGWLLVGFGVGWALLLTIIDRIIFGEPLMKDSFGYRFGRVLALRGVLAVAGSLVTSLGALIFLFSHDVNTQMAKDFTARSTSILGPINSSPVVLKAQDAITADNLRLGGLQKPVTNLQKTVAKDESNIQCEAAGTCGTHIPDDPNHIGPDTQRLTNKWKTDNTLLQAAATALKTQSPGIQADINTQQGIIDNARAEGNNVLHQDNGIQAKTDALRELVRHDWTMWLWILVIVVADLSVVLFKATLSASRVDLKHREAAAFAKAVATAYATSSERQFAIQNAVARQADIADTRSRQAYQRTMAALGSPIDDNVADNPPRPKRFGRFAAGSAVLGLVALAATGVTLATTSGSSRHPSATTSGTAGEATTSVTGPVVIRPSFAAYKLAAPSDADARRTRTYLEGAGGPLLALHRLTRSTVASYTLAECTGLRQAITHRARLLHAAEGTPDDILQELGLDEIHDIATLSGCKPATLASMAHLAGVDALFTQRLHQLGVKA